MSGEELDGECREHGVEDQQHRMCEFGAHAARLGRLGSTWPHDLALQS